ncbi:MAG TPA: transcriptional repressor [Thermoanaerobacterales bacterium]|jgi:Fe2+ or Zn2+ uptake regulation protein|nr:transcriptional repressor [Thermoanaerobacterales bacterium]
MDVENILRQSNLKITPQRKTILKVIAESDIILDSQEIYQESARLLPSINPSTVYRNLDILLQSGLICKINTQENSAKYRIREQGSHHHHIICKKCGTSIPLDFCPMEELDNKLEKIGFTPTEHRFEIFGYCQKCSK